ncbi:unnamed protein product [Aureobasidium pullulans]|nr:unnamed protein product [Aureobasidium pullulans]
MSTLGLGRARADATTPVNNSGGSGLPRYGYGKYYGRDGKQHIGVDRVGRPGMKLLGEVKQGDWERPQ